MAPNSADPLDGWLAMDTRRALVAGRDLPRAQRGAALMADLCGFSAMADALVRAWGSRRGPDELSRILDALYGGLLDLVHRAGGSLVTFAGDALVCWFPDDDGSAARGAAEALIAHVQAFPPVEAPGMAPLPIRLRTGVAVGWAERAALGDSAVRRFEVVAGPPVDAAAALQEGTPPGTVGVAPEVPPARPLPPTWERPGPLPEAVVRPWVAPERLRRSGLVRAELRLGLPVFVRVPAPTDLDAFDQVIRDAQAVVGRHGGAVYEVVTGDKGGYLVAQFGAAVAHEDDVDRALAAAAELSALPGAQVGVAMGVLRVGEIGNADRRYTVAGGLPNVVAARLMARAAPGEVLCPAAVLAAAPGWRGGPAERWALKGVGEVEVCRMEGRAARRRPARPAISLFHRADLLSGLLARAALAAEGGGGLVVLSAAPGLGKTTLLDAMAARLPAALAVEPDPTGRDVALDAWSRVHAALGGSPAEGPPTPDRLASSVEDALAARPGSVLLLDDLHGWDDTSLDVLRRVAPRLTGVLVVAACRPAGPTDDRLGALLAAEGVTLLPLEPLSPDEMDLLVAESLGVTHVPMPILGIVRQRCDGHPLHAWLLSRALVASGEVVIDGGVARLEPSAQRTDLPDSLHGAIGASLDRLAPELAEILLLASVPGRQFGLEELAAALPAEPADPRPLLARLVEAGLLEVHGTGWRFRHALVQQVAYERLEFAVRRRIHARLAAQLEARGSDAATLAHHWRSAEDGPRGLAWSVRAAEDALARHAPWEALRLAQACVALRKGMSASAEDAALDHVLLGEAAYGVGKLEQARTHLDAALAGVRAAPPRSPFGLAVSLAGLFFWSLVPWARARVERPPGPDAGRRLLAARGYDRLALTAYFQGELMLSMYSVFRSFALATGAGSAALGNAAYLRALANVGASFRSILDREAPGRALEERAVTLAAAAGKPGVEAYAWQVSATTDLGRGLSDAFLREVGRASEIYAALGDLRPWEELLVSQAVHRLLHRDRAGGEALLRQLAQSAARRGDGQLEAVALGYLAVLDLNDGRPEAAAERLRRCRALVVGAGGLGEGILVAGIEAWRVAQVGSTAEGIAALQALNAAIAQARNSTLATQGYVGAVEAAIVLHDRGVPIAELDALLAPSVRALGEVVRVASRVTLPWFRLAEGFLAWGHGRRARAEAIWRRGLREGARYPTLAGPDRLRAELSRRLET